MDSPFLEGSLHMRIRKFIAKTYMRLSSWTCSTESLPSKAVVIGAPHTSNWDGFFMVMAFWAQGRSYKFLVKDSLMKNPITRPIIRFVGGIAVDRKGRHGLVGGLVHEAKNSEDFILVLAPKGTRERQEYWKSGFYRMCLETGLPLQLGFINSRDKTYGWAGNMEITGDVEADMEKIRAFYADKEGKRPQYGSTPRLRAEDDAEARAHLLNGLS